MKNVLILMIALMMAGLTPSLATTKSLGRILADSGLSPQDFDLLSATEKSLYENVTPQPGREASWSNPDTASHGTVQLTEYRDGCVSLLHTVYPKGESAPKELRVRMCKSAEGKWLLEP